MRKLFYLIFLFALAEAAAQQTSFKFDLRPGKAAYGFTRVSADDTFSYEKGLGFDGHSELRSVDRGGDALTCDFITSGNIQYHHLALSGFIRKDVKRSDPAKPLAFEKSYWPQSILIETIKPDGN